AGDRKRRTFGPTACGARDGLPARPSKAAHGREDCCAAVRHRSDPKSSPAPDDRDGYQAQGASRLMAVSPTVPASPELKGKPHREGGLENCLGRALFTTV